MNLVDLADFLPRQIEGASPEVASSLALFASVLNLYRIKEDRALKAELKQFLTRQATPLMNITFIPIPAWNGRTGNYSPGRAYYTGPRIGSIAKVDKIVCHWINGNQALADAAFTRATRIASAHFSVQDSSVHQYVKLSDTAYHSGKGVINCESVAIEHAGSPTLAVSEATYETSARLIVDICRKLGLVPSRGLLHAHNEYMPTQCPGTLDLDRLAGRAVEIWNTQSVDQSVAPSTPAEVISAPKQVPLTFRVTVLGPRNLNVRTGPSTTYSDVPEKKLHPGDTLEIAEAVQGQIINGNSTWLRTKVSGLYIWSGGTDFHHSSISNA